VSVATARGAALWETDAFATAGYRLGTERGRWRLHAALEAGGGLVSQNLDGGGALRTPAILAVPRLATSVRVAETIALALEAQVYVGWIRKDGRDATLLAPGASLGVLWSP
jgi:hypothetical protein